MSCENCGRLASEVATLRLRLEVSDEHPYDGIDTRDQTIRILEQEIARLKDIQESTETAVFRGNTYKRKVHQKIGFCIGCTFADAEGTNKGCPTFDPKISVEERLSVRCRDAHMEPFIWELVTT